MTTPLQSLPSVTQAFSLPIDLRFKRDDLYPMPGGGNKARKIQSILQYALNRSRTRSSFVTSGPAAVMNKAAGSCCRSYAPPLERVCTSIQPTREKPFGGWSSWFGVAKFRREARCFSGIREG